jgi:integrase
MLTKLSLDALVEPGRYPDGKSPGLYIQVTAGKGGEPRRSWLYRYKIGGKTREMGLGPYPATSIAEARAKAGEAAALRAKGTDPLAQKSAQKAEAAIPSWAFAEAAEAFLLHVCNQRANSKFPLRTAKAWGSTLRAYAFPRLGSLDCRDIRHESVAAILAPLAVAKPSVATRLRSRIEMILDFAAANGRRDPNLPNPASPRLHRIVLGTAPVTKHHAAPPPELAPELYQRIAAAEGTVFRAVQWMILSATRLRETLDARFDEVDLAKREWTIPATRSKMARDHVVPMSEAMVKLYQELVATRSSDFLFPGRFGTPLASSAIAPALARIGITGITLHGWRSVAKDAMSEKLDIDHETSEFVLGHVKSGLEAAYRRGTALEKRRIAMQRYADFLTGIEPESNVVRFVKAAAE